MKSELRIVAHSVLPVQQVVEVWFDGTMVAAVYGADGPGVRVVSKHGLHLSFQGDHIASLSRSGFPLQVAEGSDGKWCKGFIFSKTTPKRCKHMHASALAAARPVAQGSGDRVTVELDGKVESFTVHRAIVVGGSKLL